VKIRKATIADIKEVQGLINEFAKRNTMIPRSLNELYENIRDIFISEEDGRITGTCSLHVMWDDLAEVRSLAVREEAQRRGIGKSLIESVIGEARALGIKRIFSLTYSPDYFKKAGFRGADKSELPHKIWGDCIKCHKFPECDEEAVILEL